MKNVFAFLFFLAGIATMVGQPSFSISLEFKFYERQKLVELSKLKSTYQLLDEHDKNIIADEADGIRETEDKNYSFTGGVIYNDLVRKFVVRNDTMTLYLKNHLKKNLFRFTIDSLTFKKGKYLITENHLSRIDFEKASQSYKESILKEVVFGKLNGSPFFYKYSSSSDTATDRVQLYTENSGNKKLLATIPLKDNFINNAEIIKIQDQFFIYLNIGYSSGDSDGKLFAIDITTLTVTEVSIQKNNYKVPDGYTYKNGFALLKDDNNEFRSVINIKSESEGKKYEAVTPYALKKNGKNQYELKLLPTVLNQLE